MGLGLLILVLQRCCVGYIVFYSFKALKQPRPSRRIPSANGAGAGQNRKPSQEAAWSKAGGGALTAGQKARRTRIRDMVRCWFIYVSYRALESWASSFAWAVPFYDEMHLLWLLFLLFSGTQGPEMLFRRLVKPFVAPYERLLDSVLGGVHDALQIVGYLITLPLESFRNWKNRRAIIADARARAAARDVAPPTRLPRAASRPTLVQPDDIFAPHRRPVRARVPVPKEPAPATVEMSSFAGRSPVTLPGGLFTPTPEPVPAFHRRPAPVVLGAGADEYRKELEKLSRPARPTVAASRPTAELETEAVDLAASVPLPRPDPDSTIVMHDLTMSEVVSPISEVAAGDEPEQGGGLGPHRSPKRSRAARKSAVASPKRTPRRRAATPKASREEAKEEAEEDDDVILPPSLTAPPTTAKKRRKLAASRSLLTMDLDGDPSLPPAFDEPDPLPAAPSTVRKRPRPSSPTFPADASVSFSQAFADLSYRPSSNGAVQLDQDFFSPTKVAPPKGKRKLHDPDEPLPTPLSSEGAESRDDPREMTLGSLRSLGSEWDLSRSINGVGAKPARANGIGSRKSTSTAKVGTGKPRSSVTTRPKALAKPTAGPSSSTTATGKKKAGQTATMDDLDLTKLMPHNASGDQTADSDLGASTSALGIGRPSTAQNARRLGSRSGSLANGLATVPRAPAPSTGVAVRKAGRAPLTDQAGAMPRSSSTRTVVGSKSATRRPSASSMAK